MEEHINSTSEGSFDVAMPAKDDANDSDKDPTQRSYQESIVSILNLTVDYSMMEPSPLEPDEFKWKLMRQRKEMIDQVVEVAVAGAAEKENDCSGNPVQNLKHDVFGHENSHKEDTGPVPMPVPVLMEQIQVPVVRIFGPIIRGKAMSNEESTSSQCSEPSQDGNQVDIHQSGCLHIHGVYPYMFARPSQAGPDASSSFYRACRDTLADKRTKETMTESDNDFQDSNLFDDRDAVKIDWDDKYSVELIKDDIHYKLEQALRNHLEQNNGHGDGGERGVGAAAAAQDSLPTRFIRQITVECGRGFYTYCNGAVAPFLRIEYYNPSHRWRVKIMLERGFDVPLEYVPQDIQVVQKSGACRHTVSENDSDVGLLQFRCYEAHIPYTMQFFKDRNLSGMSWVKVGNGRFRTPIPKTAKDRRGKLAAVKPNDPCKQDEFILVEDRIPSELYWSEHKVEKSMSMHCEEMEEESFKKLVESLGSEFWTRKETSCDLELDTIVSNILNVDDVIKEAPDDPEVHWRACPSLKEIWAEERTRMASLLPPKDNFLSTDTESQTPDSKMKKSPAFTLSVKKGADKPGAQLALKGSRRLLDSSPGLEDDFRRAMADIVGKHEKSLDSIDTRMKEESRTVMEKRRIAMSRETMEQIQDDEALEALESLMNQFSQGPIKLSQAYSQPISFQSPLRQTLKSQDQLYTQTSQNMNVLSQCITRAPQLTEAGLKEVEDDIEFCKNTECERLDENRIDPNTLTPFVNEPGDDFLSEEEIMKEEDFEKCLTMLATQEAESSRNYKGYDANHSDVVNIPESKIESSDNGNGLILSCHSQHSRASASDNSINLNGMEKNQSPLFFSGEGGMDSMDQGKDTPTEKSSLNAALAQESQSDSVSSSNVTFQTEGRGTSSTPNSCSEVMGGFFSLTKSPPMRRACAPNKQNKGTAVTLWYPIAHEINASVPWLKFTLPPHLTNNILKFEECTSANGEYLETVSKPPSASRIHRWLVRKRKKEQTLSYDKELRNKMKPDVAVGKAAMDDLDFDENARKLITMAKNRKKRVAFAETVKISTCTMHEVEEISWRDMSQDSQRFMSQDKKMVSTQDALMESPKRIGDEIQPTHTAISQQSVSMQMSAESEGSDALQGIGQQGGKIYVEGGGGFKATSASSSKSSYGAYPTAKVTMMSVELHVQCRTGKAGTNDSREISMQPDPTRDAVFAVCYVYGIDPGGGDKIQIIERGCIFVPTQKEICFHQTEISEDASRPGLVSLIGKTMGCSGSLKTEVALDERQLLLRIASIVRWKDPDALISWDTQGGGLGYLIERGLALGDKDTNQTNGSLIDMVRLFGRTPKYDKSKMEKTCKGLFDDINDESKSEKKAEKWKGSALGAEWDDRVGAGAGPSSIIGRLILNCQKIISEEVKHPNASYQPAMVWAILKKRLPYHNNLLLTKWYGSNKGLQRWRVLKHRLDQALANLLLFDALDVIGRAGEAARLSGVEFSQSFPGIRGSQYKVEGVLLRALQSLWSDERGDKKGKRKSALSLSSNSEQIKSQTQSPWKVRRNLIPDAVMNDGESSKGDSKQRGYFFYSPSKSDCNNQEALECQAMTLEPQSGFHFDPVVVCDFTALYPSLIIAYNLCYSTCAGKLEYHSTRKDMKQKGQTTEKLGPFQYPEAQTAYVLKQHMKSLASPTISKSTDRAYCVPTGSIFVSEGILKGVLPSVLDEILSTRAMLKKASKQYKRLLAKPPAAVLRQLEARQLALKYVANVTYGYTSATFSGRSAMPLLADSIVECGRRTLTNAIILANKWGCDGPWKGAKVIYGDTDSLFVKLPGRSVKEAFAFGREFCDAVTLSNPPPVQLKLEKVYMGTLLQTKKKYCGMKFDSPEQEVPTFEAKGIETIRKDQCSLTQKILRNALVTVFQEKGLGNLKDYLYCQWANIHAGRLPVSDFILTGRVRSEYRGKVGPVQAALAKRLAEADPGRKMRHKERLPYVIVASPGRSFKLRDCVLTPNELLAQWDAYTVHSQYYTTKHVNAALNRCFSLPPFKIDINTWYESAPRPQKRIHHWPVTRTGNSAMISVYFGSDTCAICGQKSKTDGSSKSVICDSCRRNTNVASFLALKTLNDVQQKANILALMCQRCNGCIENSGTYAPERIITQRKKFNPFSKHTKDTLVSGGVVSPIAICTCIDCPVSYKRHEMREAEIEAVELCNALRSIE